MSECWICRSSDVRLYRRGSLPERLDPSLVRLTDREFGQTADLYRCRTCGFISTDDATAADISSLYIDVVDPEYAESADSRSHSFAALIRSILVKAPGVGTLLDIGGGIGLLCAAANDVGFAATGIEPSVWAVDQARARGVQMHAGYFPHDLSSDERFDVITAVDVIEHVPNPVAFLSAARQRLSATGVLVVVTPDIGSLIARLMRARWWGLRPGHIGYFDIRTMDLAMRNAGLQPAGSHTFGRTFPVGYLVSRLGDLLRLTIAARWFSSSRPLRWLASATVRVDLRDTRVFFATANQLREAGQ